ncbi:AcrR family transcriptional regulator [Friedmanniella endophytica]|uniref:AcrR family transcriptional regulator n=1 Tax=Microlunatus kandeliicorticis TaxID=1759536 RepID=A0A7W3IST5_9ACTN|nr:TetR/AcrR family transcriptional regulator [Microlunatus kandeliicorticis]MBA8794586.1 AcrR family transcriptional regulator [Microlunatus kandeliicorticis]
MTESRERSRRGRVRMSSAERREQLIDVARRLFAERGYDQASVEEIAARAEVSKPVVYEHFGGKEGLYAVIVDREVRTLLDVIRGSLSRGEDRELIESAALALLDYIETHTDGFRILARDSSVGTTGGSLASVLGDVADRVSELLAPEFRRRKLDPKAAPIYAQMLVGMIALTGQWWLDNRKPRKQDVAAHLVNLAWNGLRGLEAKPRLQGTHDLS